MLNFIGITVLLSSLSLSVSKTDPASSVHLATDPGPITEHREHFENYYRCFRRAEVKVLNNTDVVFCSRQYILVKLSFIEGVDLMDFDALPSLDRAKVNTEAYRLFKQWEGQNVEMVELLKGPDLLIQH